MKLNPSRVLYIIGNLSTVVMTGLVITSAMLLYMGKLSTGQLALDLLMIAWCGVFHWWAYGEL